MWCKMDELIPRNLFSGIQSDHTQELFLLSGSWLENEDIACDSKTSVYTNSYFCVLSSFSLLLLALPLNLDEMAETPLI